MPEPEIFRHRGATLIRMPGTTVRTPVTDDMLFGLCSCSNVQLY